MSNFLYCVILCTLFSIGATLQITENEITRASVKNLEVGLGRDVSRDPLCPDPTIISPCVCSVDSTFGTTMDCSNVTSEDQLRLIFSNEFPSKHFGRLFIYFNQYLKSLRENDLGEATFQVIDIFGGVLEAVEPSALIGSASNLTHVSFASNNISVFPFDELSLYTKLESLFLYSNLLREVPFITSQTIQSLALNNNQFTEIPPGVIGNFSSLRILEFSMNPLSELQSGTFESSQLEVLYVDSCDLKYVHEGAIVLRGTDTSVYLNNNNITDVAVGAIQGVTQDLVVYNNQITELKEEVWQPLLDSVTLFTAYDNPLLCGCDIAWLILNEEYMAKLQGQESCVSGELLIELDPAIYDIFC